jgi:hypothetical protein
LTQLQLGLVLEELVRGDPECSLAVAFLVHTSWDYIAYKYGSEEFRESVIRKAARGDLWVGIATTEPGAGSDLTGISVTARREGSEYVISGEKAYISGVREARERVARTFEVTTYMMQALVSAIAVAIINIVRMFSDYVRVLAIGVETAALYELPMVALTPETVAIMTNITMAFLALLTVMNAIAIKVACGGIPEAFWQQVSILLIVTSGAVIGMRFMVEAIFSSLLVPPALIPG